MKSELPKIEPNKWNDKYKTLKEMVPYYTPEWEGNDAGDALLKIFSQINAIVVNRLNQAPKKNFVAFLDMLGIKLLPAQPARTPLFFKLAKGIENEIWIPERTQASTGKTDEHEILPFETSRNLLATPSQLKIVISIDPENDNIHIPPPGFLNGRQQNLIPYKIVSSPVAGSKNFQLDHVTELKAGDFLSLGEKDKEYVIISSVSGMIVNITDGLMLEYPSGTPVEKITQFNLFEGKNMQEHSLYIGHKDLFNIKNAANFTLFINHLPGTDTGVTSIKVSWQYWGEVKGEEGAEWREFDVIDGTQGLSKTGTVELAKIKEGEIKEKELIKDLRNRWIRCIIKEPLGTGVSRKLPTLDNIVLKVRSSGEKLLPEQAFNNDTPLDVTQSFTPFGKEPRIFDAFAIASKEVFSKKGAKIEMDIDLEKRGILGGSVALEYKDKIKMFAIGTYGRLVEVEINLRKTIDPKWTWNDHGFPPETKISPESTPSAINYSGYPEYISVFACAQNGHLVERYFNGNQWVWIDHGVPKENVKVVFDPSAIQDIYGSSIFVVGTDGSLYEFDRDIVTIAGKWIEHKPPNDIFFDCSPYADSYNVGSSFKTIIKIKTFIKDKNGHLHELDCTAGDSQDDFWTDYGLLDPVNEIKADSKPFAKIYRLSPVIGIVSFAASSNGEFYAKVFVKGSDSHLWELDTQFKNKTNKAASLDVDENGNKIKVISYPHGFIKIPENDIDNEDKHIFVRGVDNRLWERTDTKWIPHNSPPNSDIRSSAFVLNDQNKILSIFSASSQNTIIERVYSTNIWNEYKDPVETALTPSLSWEYWNQKGWVNVKGIKDETANLLKSGKIMFDMPLDADETDIAGQKSSWIRARIVGGDYGEKTFTLEETDINKKTQELISTRNSIRPPIINSLTISYFFETKQYPQKVWSNNNLGYLDHTDESRVEDKFFQPFVQLKDSLKTLYLGFEKAFKGGPINIFFASKELPFTEENKPKLEWSYSIKDNWSELKGYFDYTEGLIKSDILELIGPLDFSAQYWFGNYLFWIKGSLTKGEYEESPILDGIYPNTTWSLQAGTFKDEILGSGNGDENQKLSFLNVPVLDSQEIRVNEILTDEQKLEIISSSGENAIIEIKDEKGKVIETWVVWKDVTDFFESGPEDRHYIMDHALGQLQFGDGRNGMMPPIIDNNVKAILYQTGGGKQGNVKAGEIKTLNSSVAGVESVINPVAADSGADTTTLDEMLEIGPSMISHRFRAVTFEDFEWMAKKASRKVARVRCLPNMNNNRQKEKGWVTIVIVPDSTEPKPCPSLELRRTVRQFLESHCSNTLSNKRHIYIDSPSYAEIGVSIEIFVKSIEKATQVEREVKKKLDEFFHPLTGGLEGKGWDFGRYVLASEIFVLLENIEGLDHMENLNFTYNDKLCHSTEMKEIVKVKENFLVANGTHVININLLKEGESFGSA